jgi:hypothetical protein
MTEVLRQLSTVGSDLDPLFGQFPFSSSSKILQLTSFIGLHHNIPPQPREAQPVNDPRVKAQHCLPTPQMEIEQDPPPVACPTAVNPWARVRSGGREQPVAMEVKFIKEEVRIVEEMLQIVIGESVVTSFQRVAEYDGSQPATTLTPTLGIKVRTASS